MAEDGKSTTAVNLALASRQRGQSVLLVDADLRRGTLHAKSSVDAQSPGLAGVLAGKQRASEAVQLATFEPTRGAARGPRVALSGELQLIPTGAPAERPQTLFTGRAVDGLLGDVRAMAETVIIDGPPLGIVADMLPVAATVDGVLIVVRLEHTRPRALTRLLEQLATVRVGAVGLVVVGAETGDYYYR
jgi:Mrp family chromosome partitioning ATPase